MESNSAGGLEIEWFLLCDDLGEELEEEEEPERLGLDSGEEEEGGDDGVGKLSRRGDRRFTKDVL